MDEYETALALTRAWARTNDARRLARRWKEKAEAAQQELEACRARMVAVDALIEAAQALPDVVKTKQLQTALSKYRKARQG